MRNGRRDNFLWDRVSIDNGCDLSPNDSTARHGRSRSGGSGSSSPFSDGDGGDVPAKGAGNERGAQSPNSLSEGQRRLVAGTQEDQARVLSGETSTGAEEGHPLGEGSGLGNPRESDDAGRVSSSDAGHSLAGGVVPGGRELPKDLDARQERRKGMRGWRWQICSGR